LLAFERIKGKEMLANGRLKLLVCEFFQSVVYKRGLATVRELYLEISS